MPFIDKCQQKEIMKSNINTNVNKEIKKNQLASLMKDRLNNRNAFP